MAWLTKNVWLLCIGIAWVLVFVAWFARPEGMAEFLMAFALWLFSFGIGGIVRDEWGRDD